MPIFQSIIKKLSRTDRESQLLAEGQLSEEHEARSLLDKLLTDSRLYTQTKDYKDLLDFVVRLPNIAPFNAMLLQIQKPGLKFAASSHDWHQRFGRQPKPMARPLLILWPFGPVALVYDELDTVGKDLPRDVRSFYAQGPIDKKRVDAFRSLLESKKIHSVTADQGDNRAGSIRVLGRPENPKDYSSYEMVLNNNHQPAIQFVTIAHELAHLFLGHLGQDFKLHIPDRKALSHDQVELEAESVAYLVCARNGVESASEAYLTNYVNNNTTMTGVDVYQLMRAAGQIESTLNLGRKMKFHDATASSKTTGRASRTVQTPEKQ